MTGSATGELVGVGEGGDVTWWRVREGGGEDGLGVSVDDVVIFKKVEMTHELRRFGYGQLLYMHVNPFMSMPSFTVPITGAPLYTLSYTLTTVHVSILQLWMCHLSCQWAPVRGVSSC